MLSDGGVLGLLEEAVSRRSVSPGDRVHGAPYVRFHHFASGSGTGLLGYRQRNGRNSGQSLFRTHALCHWGNCSQCTCDQFYYVEWNTWTQKPMKNALLFQSEQKKKWILYQLFSGNSGRMADCLCNHCWITRRLRSHVYHLGIR